MQLSRTLLATTCGILCVSSALSLSACSASSDGDGNVVHRDNSSTGAGGEINLDSGSSATTSPGVGGTDTLSLGGTQNGAGGTGPDGACAVATTDAELVKEPVDIMLIIDNSGSMDEELASVEANINDNFANILQNSDIDYRVIALSRHRDDDNTSLCVSAPLSTNATCPADEPGISERFYHYSTKVESDDSLDLILDTYEPPFGGPCQFSELCDNGDSDEDDADDKYENDGGMGWSTWLRAGAKKVFLEITDANDDMLPTVFVTELTNMAPEHFGTPEAPTFIFHAITGVAEKATATDPYTPDEPVVVETCTGNSGDVTNAGENYQEIARMTGGLRLPVCQFTAYDAVFQEIAEDVIIQSNIACDFAIPEAPAGQGEINLENVAVNFSDGASDVKFGQALSEEQCEANAFYIEDQRIWLCPQTCETVRANPLSQVDVLFTCESQIIIK